MKPLTLAEVAAMNARLGKPDPDPEKPNYGQLYDTLLRGRCDGTFTMIEHYDPTFLGRYWDAPLGVALARVNRILAEVGE